MIEDLLRLPAHLRRRLAGALETGLLSPPYTIAAVKSGLGLGDDATQTMPVLEAMARMGLAGAAGAAVIRTGQQHAADGACVPSPTLNGSRQGEHQ